MTKLIKEVSVNEIEALVDELVPRAPLNVRAIVEYAMNHHTNLWGDPPLEEEDPFSKLCMSDLDKV